MTYPFLVCPKIVTTTGLDTVDEATDSIISTMKAFGIESNDTMGIIDRFNEVGNNFAITSAGIGEALQRSASALYEAGNTIDESIALVTAANSVIQNPEQVGTALKTLALRLRGAKVELEDAGLETDAMAESTATLQAKLKALTHGKVDIMLDADTFKSTTQILREMSQAWADMTDIERSSALELMGGKRQANILASVIKNFQTVEDVIATSVNSSDSALVENEKYLDSIQGKTDMLTNSMQTLWNNTLTSDFAKTLLDILNIIIKIVDATGLWNVALGALTSVFAFKNSGSLISMLTQLMMGKLSLGGGLKQLISSLGLAGVGTKLLTGALTGLATVAVGFAFSKIIEGFDNWIHRAELLREEVTELKNTYEDAKKSFDEEIEILTTSSDTDTFATLEDEFSSLARGVDQYGNNISLTTDQYERYKEICEAIVGVNPDLLAGYDSAAEAIGNNVSILSQLIELKKEEARLNAQEYLEDENLEKIQKNTKNDYDNVVREQHAKESNRNNDLWKQLYRAYAKETKDDNIQDAEILKYIIDTAGIEGVSAMDYYSYAAGEHHYDYEAFFREHGEEIKNNLSNFSAEYQSELQFAFGQIANETTLGEKKIAKANDGFLDILYQVPDSLTEYDNLDNAGKKFINNWIANDSQFKIDSGNDLTDLKDRISNMIQDLASGDLWAYVDGENIGVSGIIDKIFSFDTSDVNWIEYQQKINQYIDIIYNAIGGASNKYGITKENLQVTFGVDFVVAEEKIATAKEQVAGHIDLTTEEIQNRLNDMPAKKIQAFYSIDWNNVDWSTINEWSDVVEMINQQAYIGNTATVKSYSELTTAVEKFNEIQQQTTEIVADNIEVTQEYKDALVALGISEEELNECFDESNPLLVKNAALLRKLVTQKKQDQKATVQQAKSLSQLQYKNTVQQLQQVVKAMALEVKATGLVSSGTLNTIGILRDQLTTLKQTIQQYALLELKLSDAANAYAEFESAKERDTQLTYGDSMIEALQTLNEGFKTGQVGTEAFEFAARIIVPEEILGIEDIEKRMIAIHDYVDKNPLFADWFTIDEGEFSIALDNINNFIDDAHKAGLFTNDSSGDFFLTDAILSADEPLKEFAQVLGEAFNTEVTEGSVLAMLTELEKYDASWGNIISDLMTNPLDREINKATDALNEAITAQEEFIRNGGSLESEKYKELTTNVESAQKALEQSMFAVEQNTQKYIELETVYSALTGEITLTKDAADKLFETLGFVDENGNVTVQVDDDGTIHITDEQLKALQQKADELEAEPTIMDVQLKYDTIDAQISELQKYIDEDLDFKDSTIAVTLGITNEDEAKAKIAELTALQQTISLNYNITTTSTEQDAGALEKLTTWESEGLRFDIIANTQKLQEAVQGANALEVKDKEPKIIVQGVPVAVSAIETVKDALDSLADETINITTNKTTYEQTKRWNSKTQSWETMLDGTAHVNGTAYAGGNWGAPKTEVALTGELGPEMLVRDGRWQLIGENGAEFTQIKKNDIIFNHKQTEDLLSKGYVTGRGKAYAGGTTPHTTSGPAYYKTFGGYVGDEDVFKNGSDNWMDPWTNTADSLSDAADSISDAADEFNEVFDWIEVRLEEIEEKLGLFGAALENAVSYLDKNSIIDKMIDTNQVKLKNLNAGYQKYSDYAAGLLTKIPEKYREAAQNGAIAIEEFIGEADEITLEAINNYREWAQKAADVKQQLEETITEIRDLAIQAISNIHDAQSIRVDVENSQTEKLQNAVDYWKTKGEIPSALYYGTNGGDAASSTGMFENSYKEIEYWSKALAGMQAELNEAVQKGQIEVGSIEWYEQIDQLYQVQSEIDQAKTEIEEFQNSINDLYWDNFDELISRLEYTENDTQNLIDVMSEADKVIKPEGKTLEGGTVKFWTADEVEWTKEGVASMGLYAQQMEIAEAKTEQYAKAIDDLTADYEAGLYSENEYLEKLNELKDGQYDSIKSYQDAKDAIVDLNKERTDAVKEGIELEIDALSELIEKKKEELSADKDLYDFHKSTMSQSKEIADIQRKLAAMAGDNSASAMAQKRQLEAELAEAQAELQDSYLDRSVENQQTALDKELEDFKTEKEAEIVALDEWLTNVEAVITESLGVVQANAEQIGQTLTEKAEEYNLTVSEAVMSPWNDGALAISEYTTKFGDSMSSTTDQLDGIKAKWQEVIDKMNEAAATDIAAKERENKNYTAATKQEPVVKEEAKTETPPQTQEKAITVGGKINAKGAKIYTYAGSSKGLNQYYANDPIYTVLAEQGNWLKVRHHKLKSGVTGWFKKGSVEAYAKGTTGLKKSGLVNIDELGEELILRAENGRLSYMEKGTGIVPADLTSNLMKWGELDPTSMLEQSKPQIGLHPEIHNTEINLSITYGDMVSIGEFHGDNPDDIAKIVAKQFEKHTKDLNNAIRKFVR